MIPSTATLVDLIYEYTPEALKRLACGLNGHVLRWVQVNPFGYTAEERVYRCRCGEHVERMGHRP